MNEDHKFSWNITLVYVPSQYDTFYKPAEDQIERQLNTMTEYSDALALIEKVKNG